MKQNKFNTSFILAFLFVIVLTSSSCKKLLNQEPKNSTYLEAYWKSVRDCESAIAGNYALLRAALTAGSSYDDNASRYYMYGDAETTGTTYFTMRYNGDGLEGIQGGDFTFQYNLQSLGDWTVFYKAIAMSNTVLKQIPLIPDNLLANDVPDVTAYRNKIMGEALFIRAYSYFELTRVYGDVPLVTEAYDNPLTAPQLPRSDKAAVMKQIEDDCHKAIPMLAWGYDTKSERAVRANRGSVYALLSHLYLWRATMSDLTTDVPIAADVNNADTTLRALVAQGGYTLQDTAKYSQQFIGRSTESIFELNMSENNREGSANHIGMEFLTGKYINGFGYTPRFFVPNDYFANIYYGDTTDIRLKNNFDGSVCKKYSNVTYRNPAQETSPYLSNNMVLFRLSDMMLLQAEVAIYKNDLVKASNILNFFIDRYNYQAYRTDPTDGKGGLIYEYMLERGREMFLEGHLYFDLMRTREYRDFIPWLSDGRFKQGGFLWPITPTLFQDNKYLTQTAYWRGKI